MCLLLGDIRKSIDICGYIFGKKYLDLDPNLCVLFCKAKSHVLFVDV